MRRLLLLASLVLPLPVAAAPSVFVVNSNDANISVIDLASHQVLRTLPMLREPHPKQHRRQLS